jgi:hypothetical protein
MPYFTKQIATTVGVHTFYFNRIFTASGLRYHISVLVSRKSYSCLMEDIEGRWQLIHRELCEDWLAAAEPQLAEAVASHVSQARES